MGMSSSQARLLSLTARMHDIEYKAQRLEAQKLQLANESSRAYEDYLRVLDAKKLQYRTIMNDGSVTFRDATLATLENSLVDTYTGETSRKAFFLQDISTGAIYISKDYAFAKGILTDSMTYSGTLTQYLTDNNAPKKVVRISTVDNTNLSAYTPDSFTYEKAVPNTSEQLPDKLVSGHTYSLSTMEDLEHLSKLVNAGQDTTGVTIVLDGDFNMSSSTTFTAMNNFKGTFNGNGHTITGLKDSLFASTNGATVTNVRLSNSTVSKDGNNIGLLIGACTNTTVSNVAATGTLNGTGSSRGGLIGSANGSTITKCSFSGTVNGTSNTAGFVGYAQFSTIQNCSTSGTVNAKVQSGGFAGTVNGVEISHCRSNETINLTADGTTGNPDSGGFIGVANNSTSVNSTISNCAASGTINDNSTSAHPTIDGGFMAFANMGTTIISHCDSNVTLNTNHVCAIGFAGIWNNQPACLKMDNCNYTGSISTSNSTSTGFSHVDSGTGASHSIQITNCYTNSSLSKYTDNGYATNLGMTWASGPISNDTSVQSPSFTTNAMADDTIKMVDVGKNVTTIPNINTTTGIDSYNSNILAVLVKSGKFNTQTATSSELSAMRGKINTFLGKFSDNATDNSKLYYLNQKICAYLDGSDEDATFADKLFTDINDGVATNTGAYQSGAVIPSASRSENNNNWLPTYHALVKGTLTIPDKDTTLKANIMAALKKEKSSLTESDVTTFLGKYGSTQQDYAYLAYVNDIVTNYANGTGDLTELVNAITPPPTKISTNPSYIDDVSHYTITMNSTDESSLVVEEEDFDMDDPITKDLVIQYNLLKGGYIIIGDANDPGMDHSTEWLINMVNSGTAVIREFDYENMSILGNEVNVSTTTYLQEVQDEKELRKAEAKYEADMRKINNKDRKYDSELAAVDTERNAIKQEMDTLKNVAKDNCERTFKLFS